MSAIKQALEHLNVSLKNLENSVQTFEFNRSGAQPDMFSAAPPPPSNQNDIDVNLMAQRLDIAIEKVEEILSEAQTA